MPVLLMLKGWNSEIISNAIPFFIKNANIEDITNVKILDALELKGFISDCVRWLCMLIIRTFGSIIDFVWVTMQQVMSFSVLDIIKIADIGLNITEIAWIILGCVISVTLLLKMFSWKGDYSFLTNIFVVIFAVGVFTSFCAFCNGLQDEGVTLINEIVLGDEDVTLSESILRNSTYDLLASVQRDELVNISKDMDITKFDYNSYLKKSELQGIYEYQIDGGKVYRDLSDGVWNSGINEERYYRYYIDFLSVVFITVIVALTYILGIFKTAYLKINKFFIELTGVLVMATCITKLDKVKMIFSEVMKLTCSILWSYGVMLMTTIFVQSIINTEELNWLAKCFYMVAFMLVSLVGVDIVNKSYGMEDGTGAVVKGMFMGKRVKGMVKGAFGMGRNALGKVADGVTGMSEQAGKGIGKAMDKYDNYRDGIQSNNEFVQQAYNDSNKGLLENDKHDLMYGGEGMKPSHSYKNWDDERGRKVDDRKARYDENVSNNVSDGKPISHNYDSQSSELPKQTLPQNDIFKRTSLLANALKNNDTYTDKYGNSVPNGYSLKSYKQYKKDFYDKGDENMYNKSKFTSESGEKQLPTWFHNQDSVKSNDGEDNMSKEEARERLRMSRSLPDSRPKILTREEMLKNIDMSENISDNDKRFLHNLYPQELPREYDKIMRNIEPKSINKTYSDATEQSYDTFLSMIGKDENNE